MNKIEYDLNWSVSEYKIQIFNFNYNGMKLR